MRITRNSYLIISGTDVQKPFWLIRSVNKECFHFVDIFLGIFNLRKRIQSISKG